jgi:hypothetical protein
VALFFFFFFFLFYFFLFFLNISIPSQPARIATFDVDWHGATVTPTIRMDTVLAVPDRLRGPARAVSMHDTGPEQPLVGPFELNLVGFAGAAPEHDDDEPPRPFVQTIRFGNDTHRDESAAAKDGSGALATLASPFGLPPVALHGPVAVNFGGREPRLMLPHRVDFTGRDPAQWVRIGDGSRATVEGASGLAFGWATAPGGFPTAATRPPPMLSGSATATAPCVIGPASVPAGAPEAMVNVSIASPSAVHIRSRDAAHQQKDPVDALIGRGESSRLGWGPASDSKIINSNIINNDNDNDNNNNINNNVNNNKNNYAGTWTPAPVVLRTATRQRVRRDASTASIALSPRRGTGTDDVVREASQKKVGHELVSFQVPASVFGMQDGDRGGHSGAVLSMEALPAARVRFRADATSARDGVTLEWEATVLVLASGETEVTALRRVSPQSAITVSGVSGNMSSPGTQAQLEHLLKLASENEEAVARQRAM